LGLPAAPGVGEVKLSFPHEPTLEEVRQTYVRLLHARYSSHRGKLAAALGVSERNLYRLLQRYGLE
jgi:DNA-binding NtrC family response regulator